MRMIGKLGAATAALALLATSMPAEAQWRGRHRHHDRVDGGDVLLGALLVGGLFAVASAASRSERDRREREAYDERYDVPPPPPRAGNYSSDAYAPPPPGTPDAPGAVPATDEDAAVDACASAAESEGAKVARIARVGSITAVDPSPDGWWVRGTIDLRGSYREIGSEMRGFRCTIANGAPPKVLIDG